MAWNPSPEIAALREYARKFDRPVVVTFSIDRDGNRFHVSTYGETRKLCQLAGSFGSQLAEAIKDGTIKAPEVAPLFAIDAASVWERVKHARIDEIEAKP